VSCPPLTADWVLQSWPAIVRSSLKVLLLMMSTLHVSDLQQIFVVFILNNFFAGFYLKIVCGILEMATIYSLSEF
jgi:hypothetical protein